MTEVIRYEHVDISYKGKRVVHDVSFSVEKGEILGIVGESGSGKSTLIKAAMGLLGKDGLVTRGDIWYKGMDLPDLKPREMRKLCGPELGMIFQTAGSSFCPIRTIRAQLYEFMTEHKKIKADVFENQAKELLLYTDMRIYEVAYAVGYAAPSYFSKVYHDYMGVTPEMTRCQQSDRNSE